MNNSGIKTQKLGAPKQILLNPDLQFSVGIVVSNAKFVEEGGKKLVKAGTPMVGNLDARTTAFTVVGDSDANKVQGVLLHDVDVTNGNANGTLLIMGFVNTNRIDKTTKAKITADVKKALPMIKFAAC